MQNNYQTSQYYTNNISYDLNENNNIMNNNISPIQYDSNVKYIDTNNERGSNNEIMPTQIGILQHKLASKKTKIKNLKSNITMLIEENQRLKKRIAELEAHFEEIEINTKKYISSENDTIDNNTETTPYKIIYYSESSFSPDYLRYSPRFVSQINYDSANESLNRYVEKLQKLLTNKSTNIV